MANAKVTADPNWYIGSAMTTPLLAGAAGAGFASNFVRKTIAFTGGAGLGAVGAVPLFTVTGAVIFRMIAVCSEDLVCGAGATISVGTLAAVDNLLAVTGAADIDVGDIWFAAAPATVLNTLAVSQLSWVIGNGSDVQGNVLVDAITDGTIDFAVWWSPISANGNVVAA